jgi:glutathione peroxidase
MAESFADFTMTDIDGNPAPMKTWSGKVILVVNVASKCGFTKQYAGLEELYQRYKDKGLVILGFPANNFLRQEPGTDAEIKEFCSLKFHVTFPMFSKISVKGKDIHPLYQFLTKQNTRPVGAKSITWNFNKFLVNRKGEVVGRFESKTEPLSDEMIKAVEALLAE